MIEKTKACTVALMKARNYLVVQCREKRVNWEETDDGENLLAKALANVFWLTSKSCSWLNKAIHDFYQTIFMKR